MNGKLFIFRSLCILSVLLCLKTLAQEQDPGLWYNTVSIPPSPNAASLGKYGEYIVDKSTGVPNISIPLIDLNEGGINVKVGISYHAGGIKVQEEASCVGLGWSLNAGGVITRVMHGRPDESGPNSYLENASKIPLSQVVAWDLINPVSFDQTYAWLNCKSSAKCLPVKV
jgi:hypothetical protein